MKPVCIIPARGNSKRLPSKNIIELDKKPIILHTINSAIESKCFSQIIISSECKKILKIVKNNNKLIETDLRPKKLSADEATVADVCYELLNRKRNESKFTDDFCILTATSALRNQIHIRESFKKFKDNNFDILASVNDFFFYPQRALIKKKKGCVFFFKELCNLERDKLPHFFVENGAITWVKIKKFLRNKKLFSNNTGYYKMSKVRSIDIDTIEDFFVLESIYNSLKKKKILNKK